MIIADRRLDEIVAQTEREYCETTLIHRAYEDLMTAIARVHWLERLLYVEYGIRIDAMGLRDYVERNSQ